MKENQKPDDASLTICLCRLISLMEKHFLNRQAEEDVFSAHKEEILPIARAIFEKNGHFSMEDCLQIIQHRRYVSVFLMIYLGYLNDWILDTLLSLSKEEEQLDTDDYTHLNKNSDNIGYIVNVEKRLLDDVIGGKEELKDLMIASGMIQKNKKEDNLKNTLIVTQGEGLLPMMEKKFKLDVPLKSCYVQAQLHQDYVQLTLYQVVKLESHEEKEGAASIIVQDKIIPVENIYDSICKRIWSNIIFSDNVLTSYEGEGLLDCSREAYRETLPRLKEHIRQVVSEKE